jgi:lipoprotein-anchoring transpeptidase ErfK/SrfK
VRWLTGVAVVLLAMCNAHPGKGQAPPVGHAAPASQAALMSPAARVSPAAPASPATRITPASTSSHPTPGPTCPDTLVATRRGRVYDVVRREGSHWRVLLPVRPNGTTGLIPVRGTRITATDWAIRVSVSARRLTLYRHCQVVRSTLVGVGKPATPTPRGRFYITELYRKPGPYGPFAYSLSAHSNVLRHFDGGEGRVGLHGAAKPSDAGRAVSHGCVRIPDQFIRWLVGQLPLGTPVVVR